MQASIINGRAIAAEITENLKSEILKLSELGIKPKLSIILIGQDAPSKIYVNNKIRKASELAIATELSSLNSNISEQELIEVINLKNQDQNTHGIIVQMPIPNHINKLNVISTILPDKDVDGFNPWNVGLNNLGFDYGMVPCTALGVLHLIKSSCLNLAGKHVAIIGRSDIVGKPLASLLLNNNATITLCHSKTKNLAAITKKADIIVTATGNSEAFGVEYFSVNQIVIDVGINYSPNSTSLVGDVKFSEVVNLVSHISPVPGGVGPMTVAYLMSNVIKAAKKINKII